MESSIHQTVQSIRSNTPTSNSFFKNKQKLDLAEKVQSQIDISTLIQKTIYVIPGTNRIYMDYPLFKLYGGPSVYNAIIEHIVNTFRQTIDLYGSFEAHLNMQGFTISAAQRYRDLIYAFCNECLQTKPQFSQKLIKMHIYNTPQMIDNITTMFGPLCDPIVREKLVLHNKHESGEMMDVLLNR
jgi:hypothetical protein